MYARGGWTGIDELCGCREDRERCDQRGPYGFYVCTREFGHEMPHRASIGTGVWCAEWDDDRSTDDRDESDYWTSLGL